MKRRTSRPVIKRSLGFSTCAFCKRPFERIKTNQRYDTDYCRAMDWQQRYRKSPAPPIVEVDGKKFASEASCENCGRPVAPGQRFDTEFCRQRAEALAAALGQAPPKPDGDPQ